MARRRAAVEKAAARLRMSGLILYILVVSAEAALGWFFMGKFLDQKLGWSFIAILIIVLIFAIAFECIYEFWLAGDDMGRRSGGQ